MNGIVINDKQYIYTVESTDCNKCAFHECEFCGNPCEFFRFLTLKSEDDVTGIFKELKIEK